MISNLLYFSYVVSEIRFKNISGKTKNMNKNLKNIYVSYE